MNPDNSITGRAIRAEFRGKTVAAPFMTAALRAAALKAPCRTKARHKISMAFRNGKNTALDVASIRRLLRQGFNIYKNAFAR